MNEFEKLLTEFFALTGLDAKADARDAFSLESDGIIYTIQYRRDANVDEILASIHKHNPLIIKDDDNQRTIAKNILGDLRVLFDTLERNIVLDRDAPLEYNTVTETDMESDDANAMRAYLSEVKE